MQKVKPMTVLPPFFLNKKVDFFIIDFKEFGNRNTIKHFKFFLLVKKLFFLIFFCPCFLIAVSFGGEQFPVNFDPFSKRSKYIPMPDVENRGVSGELFLSYSPKKCQIRVFLKLDISRQV
jgi:hypothetical protein